VSHVSYEAHHGFNERKQIASLHSWLSSHSADVTMLAANSNYLYSTKDLPFALENMPDTFSPFRRKVEKYCEVDLPHHQAISLDLATLDTQSLEVYELGSVHLAGEVFFEGEQAQYKGGESAALARIEDYFFDSDRIAEYKETRNGLDGWGFSSRLSAFLAHGCVSPRYVVKKIKDYENQKVANDSTYWLFFELLWREFFHLQHLKHGSRFFASGGVQQKQPSHQHSKERFDNWCKGDTGYKIVDACMKQLNATGFMSNRGRQLVASCFVHELNLDWRYGAAYFEQQLIDFDVASNWGNWQYLAGVGADPRGHRQFNLEKQTDIYDPKHKFIDKWLNT
jgi:deoxyribodipyrimidine photo-lyase